MTETTKATGQQECGPASEQLASLVAGNEAAFAEFSRAFQTYTARTEELQSEVTKFANARLRHDFELAQALASCKTWAEVASLQQAWLRDASDEYMAEARKLMGLSAQMSPEGWMRSAEQPSQRAEDSV